LATREALQAPPRERPNRNRLKILFFKISQLTIRVGRLTLLVIMGLDE